MKAIHVSCSIPVDDLSNDTLILNVLDDYYLLTQIISALSWRKHNGSIKLYTDDILGSYYKQYGFDKIYDLGIDDCLSNETLKNINMNIFWSAGKLYALLCEDAPITIIDLDLIVWKDINSILSAHELCISHFEIMHPAVYKPCEEMYIPKDFSVDDLDFNVLPSNTAIIYFKDNGFKNYYCLRSIDFMKKVKSIPDNFKKNSIYPCFAEQRLLSMCAKNKNITPYPLISFNSSSGYEKLFTHLWGYKGWFFKKENIRTEYCLACICIINEQFPEYIELLKSIPTLSKYF